MRGLSQPSPSPNPSPNPKPNPHQVRDFEKALKIQWEVYANGLSPIHIVVARSDWLYGTSAVV